jgi:hypothetical protein
VTALQISQCDLVPQDLAHVEESRQATPYRKGFNHDVVHSLRDTIDQLGQLLFAAAYVVGDDPSWWILSAIEVHGAQACYRSMRQSYS